MHGIIDWYHKTKAVSLVWEYYKEFEPHNADEFTRVILTHDEHYLLKELKRIDRTVYYKALEATVDKLFTGFKLGGVK